MLSVANNLCHRKTKSRINDAEKHASKAAVVEWRKETTNCDVINDVLKLPIAGSLKCLLSAEKTLFWLNHVFITPTSAFFKAKIKATSVQKSTQRRSNMGSDFCRKLLLPTPRARKFLEDESPRLTWNRESRRSAFRLLMTSIFTTLLNEFLLITAA